MSRSFNGTTDRLDWSSIADLGTSALTISAWVYSDGPAGNADYIVCLHRSGDAAIGIIFSISSNTSLNFYRAGSVANMNVVGAVANSWAGWLHLLVTHDGSTTATNVHIYRNGTEISYGTQADGGGYATTGSSSIGGRIFDDNRNFDGLIAEVGVWDAVLDGDTITALAAGALPRDFATNLKYYYSGATDTTTAETGGAAATVDGTSFSTSHPLKKYTPSEATQAQSSDAASISFTPAGGEATNITPGEATQAQASDAASIKAIYLLAPGEATQAQASDAASFCYHVDDICLEWVTNIAPAEATQAQSSDAAVITTATPIAPAEATQAQTSDAAILKAVYPLSPAEAAQAQSSDAATIKAIYPIAPAEATQAQTSDAVTVRAIYTITPAEATQAQSSDAAVVAGAGTYPIAPAEATQAQTSDAVTITAIYPITPAEATQSQTSDAASIAYYSPGSYITPAEATQAQTADAPSLSVIYVVTVADATQAQTSDIAVLSSPVTAYPPGERRLGEMAVRANSVFAPRATLEVDD